MCLCTSGDFDALYKWVWPLRRGLRSGRGCSRLAGSAAAEPPIPAAQPGGGKDALGEQDTEESQDAEELSTKSQASWQGGTRVFQEHFNSLAAQSTSATGMQLAVQGRLSQYHACYLLPSWAAALLFAAACCPPQPIKSEAVLLSA